MCVPFHEASPARIYTREKPKPKQWRHTVAGAMGRVHRSAAVLAWLRRWL